MPLLVLIGAAALGTALPLLGWSIVVGRDPNRVAVVANLDRFLTAPEPDDATSGARVDSFAQKFATAGTSARLKRQLLLAGRPPAWPLARLLIAKLALLLFGAMAGLFFVSAAPSVGRIVMTAVVVAVMYAVPDLLIYSRGLERQQKIGEELADTLDQMTIAVEAGLGFEAAMARVAHNGTGPLAYELSRTMQDMQVGQSRRAAYEAMADRTTVTDLRSFIRAIIRADVYGVAVAGVLRTQASEMRMKRRQRAEEKAMQVPVKVIFPLMLCILPVLFIVLLGPAVLNAMASFG